MSIGTVKSKASSADSPMSRELEAQLRGHLVRHDGKSDLLFVNRRGRPLCADKPREKQLHPLLKELGIEKGGFHSLRHGTASARLWCSVNCATATRESPWQFTRTF
jgi:hypothetical protein